MGLKPNESRRFQKWFSQDQRSTKINTLPQCAAPLNPWNPEAYASAQMSENIREKLNKNQSS